MCIRDRLDNTHEQCYPIKMTVRPIDITSKQYMGHSSYKSSLGHKCLPSAHLMTWRLSVSKSNIFYIKGKTLRLNCVLLFWDFWSIPFYCHTPKTVWFNSTFSGADATVVAKNKILTDTSDRKGLGHRILFTPLHMILLICLTSSLSLNSNRQKN